MIFNPAVQKNLMDIYIIYINLNVPLLCFYFAFLLLLLRGLCQFRVNSFIYFRISMEE